MEKFIYPVHNIYINGAYSLILLFFNLTFMLISCVCNACSKFKVGSTN